MSVLTTILIAISLSFLLVPVGRKSNKFPVNMTLAIGCDYDNHNSAALVLMDLDSNACHLKSANGNQSETNFSVVLEECGYVCYNKNQSSNYNKENQLSSLNLSPMEGVISTEEFRDAVFLSKDWSLNVSCSKTLGGEETCIANTQNGDRAGSSNVTLGLLPPINSLNATGMFTVSWMAMESDSGQKMRNVQCTSNSNGQKLHQKFYYQDFNRSDNNNNNTVYQFCLPQCIVRANRSDLCSNMAGEEIFNPQLTFGLYMMFRSLFDMACGVLDLFVGASVALTDKVGGDYGFQRMFGFVGIAIFSPISGALIDYFSSDAQGNVR